MSSMGPVLPPGVPPLDLVPKPASPGPPLLAFVNTLPGAPSESRLLQRLDQGARLFLGTWRVAPKGWAEGPRASRPALAPRPGMWKAPLPSLYTMGHTMVVCLVSRGPAPTLLLCETFCGYSVPALACNLVPPADASASPPALFPTLSSFCSEFAQVSGRK